ncbi:unnamed protein product, partial [Meganyctiphanes norvegica]
MAAWVWLTPLLATLIFTGTNSSYSPYEEKSVEILELQIPESPKEGDNVKLTCRYRLTGDGHKLYTVNWWRGKDQFYTYKESGYDRKHAYTFAGLTVMKDASDADSVVLRNVSEKSSGEYKCEVMGEGPAFKTVVKTKDMMVIVPPSKVEIKSGDMHKVYYSPGDVIHLNCSAKEANPKARLTWHVNGKQVTELETDHRSFPDHEDYRGHITSTLGLKWVAPRYFVDGQALVVCTATVGKHNFTDSKLLHLDPRAMQAFNQQYASA